MNTPSVGPNSRGVWAYLFFGLQKLLKPEYVEDMLIVALGFEIPSHCVIQAVAPK